MQFVLTILIAWYCILQPTIAAMFKTKNAMKIGSVNLRSFTTPWSRLMAGPPRWTFLCRRYLVMWTTSPLLYSVEDGWTDDEGWPSGGRVAWLGAPPVDGGASSFTDCLLPSTAVVFILDDSTQQHLVNYSTCLSFACRINYFAALESEFCHVCVFDTPIIITVRTFQENLRYFPNFNLKKQI